MSISTVFSEDVLQMNSATETERITTAIRKYTCRDLRRKGAVVAISGGIDSSVVATLCVRALGTERVLGLLMPEKDSAQDTIRLSRLIAHWLNIETITEDITPILEAVGCYRRRDKEVRSVLPEYGPGYKCKIVLPSVVDSDSYRVFSVVAESERGGVIKARLTPKAYLGIVAATNFKQRVRKMLEYYHADKCNYAVVGTPNRLEYDQGFFVKNGDGAADIKPIAHLYKTQVYQLAEYMGLPDEIQMQLPTTDTYPMEQSQEEFYFSLPYDRMDMCLYARDNEVDPEEVGLAIGLSAEQVERVYKDIDSKRKTTAYQHMRPLLVENVF